MKIISLYTFIAVMVFASAILVNGQTTELDKAKSEIAELLKMKSTIWKRTDINPDRNSRQYYGTQKNIMVFDDRIEFTLKQESTIIYFSDIADFEISSTSDGRDNSGVIFEDFLIMLHGTEKGKKLADDLIFIQTQIRDQTYTQQLKIFEPIAAQYRAMKVKPVVSEEQRKYIVQANLFNEQKNYFNAIELYKKAIEMDQTAYPVAYSNMALLSAQLKKYYTAIFYMKKYLLLVPEASDARVAQDKIYEWEIMMGK